MSTDRADIVGKLRTIVVNKQSAYIDGLLVDTMTAQTILSVYEGFKNPESRQKFNQMSVRKMAETSYKLAK